MSRGDRRALIAALIILAIGLVYMIATEGAKRGALTFLACVVAGGLTRWFLNWIGRER